MRRFTWSLALAAALFIATTGASPERASAQVPAPVQITSGFKGVIGLGLFGAELGFTIPTLAGLNETWSLILFPIVGAGAGATIGYFALEGGSAELNVAVLAIGMALIIPAFVLTLTATAYDPDDEAAVEQEGEGSGGPVQAEDYEVGGGTSGATTGAPADGAQPPAAAPAPAPTAPQGSLRHRGAPVAQRDARDTGLVRVTDRGVFLGVPSIATVPTYTLEEMQRLGIREQRSEVRVAVFSATF